MDATVDDFFNEINEIAPTKVTKKPEAWQECHDELTGYSYYWNTKTDEVTWTAPSSYIPAPNHKKTNKAGVKKQLPKFDLYVPPKIAPPLPCSSKIPDSSVKIYSIQQNLQKVANLEQNNVKGNLKKPSFRQPSDSDDEKIELISSYGGESESDTEVERSKEKKEPENVESEDDDDESDLLAKIQQRAKELQELEKQSINNTTKKAKTKNISGFSLVAGYSDSDSENEAEPVKSSFPLNVTQVETKPTPAVSHSTLFPIAQPVDIKDFETKREPHSEVVTAPKEDFDSKAFQRKRRIGISLVNTAKKPKADLESEVTDVKKGFGFSEGANQDNLSVKKENPYAGFQKGGVLFVKSGETVPSVFNKEESNSVVDIGGRQKEIDTKEVKDNYSTLKEKLTFLTEGHEAVLPVQVMLIQANTLFLAMEEDGLKLSYLQKWLSETCAELIKLEKEAAPEGWLLQWDRLNKRYYYQSQSTGASQWDYPQSEPPPLPPPDEVSGGEDVPMDICTTPPHPGIPETEPAPPMSPPSPPLPPCITSPSPPPPPIISMQDKMVSSIPDVPLPPSPPPPPPPPPPPVSVIHNNEPLPPGVDLPEMISYNTIKETPKEPPAPVETSDPLNSALDSFYSEIAATETTLGSPAAQEVPADQTNQLEEVSQTTAEPLKKKKKTKVKLAPGLSMKKKGVSQLVEKWKNVQKNYD